MSMSEQGEADEMTADQAFLLGGTTARGGGLGWWWHTTEDTIDKVDRDNLIRDTRVYIETVGRLATEPVVALDVRAALDEIAASLETIKPLWAGLPSDGTDDDPGFSALEADIASAQQAADRVMAKLSAGDRSDTQSQQLSDSIVTACKALVPVNYTLTGQFDHDLALGASPLPALRPHRPVVEMSDDEQWGASHQLRRSINRVRAGVRAATSALETASAS
jgi:hypothetical protein